MISYEVFDVFSAFTVTPALIKHGEITVFTTQIAFDEENRRLRENNFCAIGV